MVFNSKAPMISNDQYIEIILKISFDRLRNLVGNGDGPDVLGPLAGDKPTCEETRMHGIKFGV